MVRRRQEQFIIVIDLMQDGTELDGWETSAIDDRKSMMALAETIRNKGNTDADRRNTAFAETAPAEGLVHAGYWIRVEVHDERHHSTGCSIVTATLWTLEIANAVAFEMFEDAEAAIRDLREAGDEGFDDDDE